MIVVTAGHTHRMDEPKSNTDEPQGQTPDPDSSAMDIPWPDFGEVEARHGLVLEGEGDEAVGDEDGDGGGDAAPDGAAQTEPEPKQEQPDPERAERLERAMQALRRDQVHKKVLDATDEDTLLEWGEAARQRQADSDRAFREAQGARAKKPAEGGDEPKSEDAEQSAQPSASPDLDNALRNFAEHLDEESGEALGSVTKALRALMEEGQATLRAENQQLGEQVQALQAHLAEQVIADAQRAVFEPYGEVSAESIKRIRERARDIANEQPGKNVREYIGSATREVLGDPPDRSKQREERASVKSATSSTRLGRSPSGQELTFAEQFAQLAGQAEQRHGLR